jgi:hypothetical protein
MARTFAVIHFNPDSRDLPLRLKPHDDSFLRLTSNSQGGEQPIPRD